MIDCIPFPGNESPEAAISEAALIPFLSRAVVPFRLPAAVWSVVPLRLLRHDIKGSHCPILSVWKIGLSPTLPNRITASHSILIVVAGLTVHTKSAWKEANEATEKMPGIRTGAKTLLKLLYPLWERQIEVLSDLETGQHFLNTRCVHLLA